MISRICKFSVRDDKRIAWIAGSIACLDGFGVKDALDRIRAQGITAPEDIGTHLFKSGRCAMAHGARKPIIDPDNSGDLRRLGAELPIVRALATKAIEEVFGAFRRRPATVRRGQMPTGGMGRDSKPRAVAG